MFVIHLCIFLFLIYLSRLFYHLQISLHRPAAQLVNSRVQYSKEYSSQKPDFHPVCFRVKLCSMDLKQVPMNLEKIFEKYDTRLD